MKEGEIMNGRNKQKWTVKQIDENEWRLIEPKEATHADESFDLAWELMEKGQVRRAKEAFQKIVKLAPSHIDNLHHLAIILDDQGKKDEALKLWEKAVKMGKDALSNNFKEGDRLEWICLENRPFLRSMHSLGCAYLDLGKKDQALAIFEEILSFNPNDNQGIRELLLELYLDQNKIDSALSLCRKYPEDGLAGILYGHPLVLFKKYKSKKKATNKLEEAIELSPKIADELLKKRHREPKETIPGYITSGGWDEAYEYWEYFGRFWGKEELTWLKKVRG